MGPTQARTDSKTTPITFFHGIIRPLIYPQTICFNHDNGRPPDRMIQAAHHVDNVGSTLNPVTPHAMDGIDRPPPLPPTTVSIVRPLCLVVVNRLPPLSTTSHRPPPQQLPPVSNNVLAERGKTPPQQLPPVSSNVLAERGKIVDDQNAAPHCRIDEVTFTTVTCRNCYSA
ncbi:hypothetical protein ACLOJK_039188 [Asimina triloba]